jgi:syntaxin-binding protein 5
MFMKHRDPYFRDLSYGLSDDRDWSPAALWTLDYYLDISALAIEPLSGLLAVGKTSVVRTMQVILVYVTFSKGP